MPVASRPNLTRVVRAVIQDAASRLPEFSHIKASRILVVVGEAHLTTPLPSKGRS